MSWRDLYPFKENFVTTPNGHKMHYVDEGSGEAFVMIHGNPTWSFLFRDLIKQCAGSGNRALAADMVGCGLSDKPQDWPYHLDGHVKNVEHWLNDVLKLESMTLVLHDWGGAIGMGYATRHPEKIKRIVLMNTAAYLSSDCPRRIFLCRCPVLGAVLVRGFNAFVEAALRMAPAGKLPADVCEGYRYPYGNWHDRIATQRFVQDIPLKTSHPSWNTLSEIEKRLPLLKDKPISLIWGEQDFCFHTGFLERWKKIYPDAKVHSFPEASHYLLEDKGSEIIPLILNSSLK